MPLSVFVGEAGQLAVGVGPHTMLTPADGPRADEPAEPLEVTRTVEAPPAGELPVPDLLPAAAHGPSFSGTGIAGTAPAPAAGADSLRVALAWFPDGRAFALQALRPAKAKGHDRDEVAALVVEEGVAAPVEDPRLSVTFGKDGLPRRVGLELWLPRADDVPEYARRAAGEIDDDGFELGDGGMSVSGRRVSWRSRGQAGPGIFLVIRPR